MNSLWVYFLSPLAALAAAVLAYFFGSAQGRDQARFLKQGETLNELRTMIFDVKLDIGTLPNKKCDPHRENFSRELAENLRSLTSYRRRHGPWLSSETRSKVDPLLDRFTKIAEHLLHDEGINDTASSLKYEKAIEVSNSFDLDKFVEELDVYADRLMMPRMSLITALILVFLKNLPGADSIRRRFGYPPSNS